MLHRNLKITGDGWKYTITYHHGNIVKENGENCQFLDAIYVCHVLINFDKLATD